MAEADVRPPGPPNSPNPSSSPNLVFVLTDDQGYGDLGCHGNPVVQTPHIDRFFDQSVRLDNFHVGPTCAPTRAGLLTGHYCNSTGVWHTCGGRSLLRKGEVSIADLFAANGYRTGIFGKWHLGDNYPYRPHDRGFGEAIVHGGGGITQTPDYWGNDYFDDTYFVNGCTKKFEGYCTDVWFGEAMRFIEENRERPFFCYIPTNAPHWPFFVDERYAAPYHGLVPSERAKFYGMITNIDENFALLRQHLARLGLEEQTILVFMSDNGTAQGCEIGGDGFVIDGFNAGMRGKKGSPYEGGHRVPFFVRWPGGGIGGGAGEGRRVGELAANVDFLPTMVELCGLECPEGLAFDGVSLAPLLRGGLHGGGEPWPERTVVTDSQRLARPVKWRQSSTMTQRWRLIDGRELFDIPADPEQRVDVAGAHPEVVEALRRDYEAWWEQVSTQFDEEIPIPLVAGPEQVTLLTTHDWRNEDSACAWNQRQVRQGLVCNGYWEVEVVVAGRYAFELRRWPLEEDRGLTEGIPGEIDWTTGGRAIPIERAWIEIAGQREEVTVRDGDPHARFELELPVGATHLRTCLLDAEGSDLGAYYVYVSRLR
ncbi:MAG: arylsulfatase [Myxococcota bacterium]